MLSGILSGLIIAVILSCFDMDDIFIKALQPFTKVKLTHDHYYLLFGIIGMISGIIG